MMKVKKFKSIRPIDAEGCAPMSITTIGITINDRTYIFGSVYSGQYLAEPHISWLNNAEYDIEEIIKAIEG